MAGLDQLERFANNLDAELRLAVRDTLAEGQRIAIRHSSGTLTEADLRRLDHPYALRHGRPQQDPDVINERTGNFRRGWTTSGPTAASGGYQGAIFNTDPKEDELKAGLVRGFRMMFHRSPDEKTAAELAPIFEANVLRAIVRAAR